MEIRFEHIFCKNFRISNTNAVFIHSCHAIDNPSMRSEISMLRQYGPNVPEETLSRLVKAFSELRTMADEGQIQV